jgi:hypothetical protein
MTIDSSLLLRLHFLCRVVNREAAHLAVTDQRFFDSPINEERVRNLACNVDLAEQVDAFVSRFARLQDTVGDKLLPSLLTALGENPGAAIDNMDAAERLNWIRSADEWLAMRKLRNQMVHEYIEDPVVLANALQMGHEFVPVLTSAGRAMLAEIQKRGWAENNASVEGMKES